MTRQPHFQSYKLAHHFSMDGSMDLIYYQENCGVVRGRIHMPMYKVALLFVTTNQEFNGDLIKAC